MNNLHALPLNGPHSEAWLVWGILVSLFLVLVAISAVALWRASRVHQEDDGVKSTTTTDTEPHYFSFNCDCGIRKGLPIPTDGEFEREHNATIARLSSIGETRGKVSEDKNPGSIERGQKGTLPVPPVKQKGLMVLPGGIVEMGPKGDKQPLQAEAERVMQQRRRPRRVLMPKEHPSDHLLGHGITSEERQAAIEDHPRAYRGMRFGYGSRHKRHPVTQGDHDA